MAGMAVAPCKIQLVMQPGDKQETEFYILNDSRNKLRVALSTWDFARDRQGRPFPIRPEELKTFRGCGSWVAFHSRALTLDPGQTEKAQIGIEVPPNPGFGSYYTYIQVLGTPLGVKGDVLVKSKINALLLVTIGLPSDIAYLERAMQVRGLKVKPVNFSGPVSLAPIVENKGNYHLNLEGNIQIKQGKKVIKKIPVKECTLLPKDKLQINKVWEDPPPLGKFTAQFSVKSPGLDKVLTAQTNFWVVSRNFIIAVSATVALFGGALLASIRFGSASTHTLPCSNCLFIWKQDQIHSLF
jgi:hypothetical protein